MRLGAGCQCCALVFFLSAIDAAPGHKKCKRMHCVRCRPLQQLNRAKQVLEHPAALVLSSLGLPSFL